MVVRIEPVEDQAPTLFEALKNFDGMAGDLPSDLASNSEVIPPSGAPSCQRMRI
jgi:hypothetical protein